jgi:ATP-dependent helicase Lhr and Lhr-like helicase
MFLRWFAGRGWSPREHQLDLLQKARDDRSALLIAPTGAGKTLAGFLPTLVELSSPLPPRGGGEGVGGVSASSRSQAGIETVEAPPTPDLESELRSPRTPPRARARGRRGEEHRDAMQTVAY